jgi:Flp pilus assembly protein CpaB
MNRSRTLILLGVVLLLVAVVVLVLGGGQTPPPTAQVPPTPVEIPTTQIMVAAQNIPRGTVIGPDAIIPFKWPNANLPGDLAITDPALIIGKIARTDILRLQPILRDLISADPGDLAKSGCDAALGIPAGKVAVAFPINQISSAGYSIGKGDHVDVLVAFSVLDVNQEDQYPSVPFNRDFYNDLVDAGVLPPAAAPAAVDANNGAIAQALPQAGGGKYLPRLVTQLTLQNIEVLNVGDWPAQCQLLQKPPVILTPDQAPPPTVPPVVGTPTPTPPRPTVLILTVNHQQALILQWLRNAQVSIELALRSAVDNAPVVTESVHYQYLLSTYAISKPPKTDTVIQQPPATGR